jgi:transcriptional regulator with XRE-family HTH domain
VADKLYITQSAYAKLESGVSRLDVLRLLEIAKLFNIPPSQLLIE